MNNRMLAGKPLYVALAQRKEDRKAQLASQYMHRMAANRMQHAGGMPFYAPANAGFYIQGNIPQRAAYPNAMTGQMRGNVPRWTTTGIGNTGYGSYLIYLL
jgi:polyadenylate-binding protein